jgi:thioredoxin reductase (NADPH)
VAEFFDVIVIGGGASGSAAAAFTAGRGWNTCMADKNLLDGYLGSLGHVCQFPGFPEGIAGREIVERLRKQAEKAGAKVLTCEITEINAEEGKFVAAGCGETLEARAAILATGAAARTGFLTGEKEFFGRGVFHDARTDGPCNSAGEIAVIGKSKLAAEEAIFLSKYADKIHFVIPSNRLDADSRIFGQVQHERKIELHFSTSIKTINGTDRVTSITVFTGGQEKEIPVSTVFTYMHEYQPMNQFIKNVVQTAQNGSVMVGEQLETSVPGVFACGDILCAKPQMPAISVAQGILAGIGTDQYLISKI